MGRSVPDLGALPTFGDGRRLTVGLLGGTFDPAHEGHQRLAKYALRYFGLDQVWLMVTPGNPFKKHQMSEKFDARLRSARRIADGKRVIATDIEARFGTTYTAQTLKKLMLRFPHIRFVWVMGADSFASLTRWNHWRDIVKRVPIAVLPRPGEMARALRGQTAQALRRSRLQGRRALVLSRARPPGWAFLLAPHCAISSTEIRRSVDDKSKLSSYYQLEHEPIVKNVFSQTQNAATPSRNRPKSTPSADQKQAAPTGAAHKGLKKDVAAGPGGKRAKRAASSPEQVEAVLTIIQESLAADKAEDIVIIDLVGRASFADKMVIATGQADRQIAAMAEHIEKSLKEAGIKRILIEGAGGSDWVLLDAGDIVVHLFKPESRQHYALERMWAPELDDDADD